MHKLILIMLLAVASGNAIAEWVKLDDTDYFTLYADNSTIVKNGNLVIMRHLHDEKNTRKTVTSESYKSTKELVKYDCMGSLMRTLAFSLHAEQMGGGKVIYQDNFPSNWIPVQSKTIDETLLKYACGKK